tara:strand:+ start:1281 stop:1442 length:162 start_codon:yes stop_codon:yes gene_type:complete
MNYKIVFTDQRTNETIYGLVDENGDFTITCTSEYPPFQKWVAEGNTPLPADSE